MHDVIYQIALKKSFYIVEFSVSYCFMTYLSGWSEEYENIIIELTCDVFGCTKANEIGWTKAQSFLVYSSLAIKFALWACLIDSIFSEKGKGRLKPPTICGNV